MTAAERKLANDADTKLVETVARIFHAVAAGLVTMAVAELVGLGHDTVREVALVNAGLAYYTDDVTGRIVDALNAIVRHLPGRGEDAQYAAWLRDHQSK